jgi:hypothetical protein
MDQWNHILCFTFTLMIILLLHNQCSIKEGLDNLNSFTNCIDDKDWFTENNDGMKFFCSDIGNGASCYDRNNAQVEGWERCLKTCGNCSTPTISIPDMRTLASFAGDPIEDFGVVLFSDTDRQWVGKGVGGSDSGDSGDSSVSDTEDIRGYVDNDQSDSILDLYDRLSSIEDFTELLFLGTDNRCIDLPAECASLSSAECNDVRYPCQILNNGGVDTCIPNGLTVNTFYSCTGDILPCTDYGTDDTDGTDGTEYTYIKHICNGDDCNIVLPTYEFTCGSAQEYLTDDDTGTSISETCKQYILFDTMLDSDDSEDTDDPDDTVGTDTPQDRISLYDMCPTVCADSCRSDMTTAGEAGSTEDE